jgi:chemosensory pili system protein ChpA (sensor histidine kinase/response regulator)
VVDDDPVVRQMFVRSLELAGFDAVAAADGEEGLRILRDDPSVALVLLDLTMSGMDGWTFLQEQRADERLAAIPTVIISGSPLAKPEALRTEEFLQKPVDRERLVAVVSAYCRRRER